MAKKSCIHTTFHISTNLSDSGKRKEEGRERKRRKKKGNSRKEKGEIIKRKEKGIYCTSRSTNFVKKNSRNFHFPTDQSTDEMSDSQYRNSLMVFYPDSGHTAPREPILWTYGLVWMKTSGLKGQCGKILE
jgi:hypothetical protein